MLTALVKFLASISAKISAKILATLLISTASMAATESVTAWTFEDKSSVPGRIEVLVNSAGKETVLLESEFYGLAVLDVMAKTPDEYEAYTLQESDTGELLYDLELSIVTGKAFESLKLHLQGSHFRDTFDSVPESCPEVAKGFLIVNDFFNDLLVGYCLQPVKPSSF